jgi:predicted dehydrogenase
VVFLINVAIVGTGSIAESHIEAFLTLKDKCKLVAFAARNPENAREKARKFNLDLEVVDTYNQLLSREDIQLVSICTPPYNHAEMAIEFLKAKKHVILEKPMALSLEQCDEMIKAAEENNRILSVVAQNRFTDEVIRVKRILEEGLIGKILHVQVDALSWRGLQYFDMWWRGTWEKEGGGCTMNQAIHHIDILNWFMGMPEEVTAIMGNVAHHNSELEDISIAFLKYANGAISQITSSIVHHGEEKQIVIQGEKARVSFPWKVYASKAKETGFPERDESFERELQEFYDSIDIIENNRFEGQIKDVLEAVETGSKPLVSAFDGRNAVEVVSAIYKAASTKQTVKLPILKEDTYYNLEGILKNIPRFNILK